MSKINLTEVEEKIKAGISINNCSTGGNPVYRFHSGFSSSHKSGGLRSSLALVTKLKINYIKFSKVRYKFGSLNLRSMEIVLVEYKIEKM